ncbi:MAG: hypothetical protein ACOC33_01980 [bacterium]
MTKTEMIKTVHVIGSPNQNPAGEPMVHIQQIPHYQTGEIIKQHRIMEIFVHFATLNEEGRLEPHFIGPNEQFIFQSSNELLGDKIESGKIRHKYTAVSHLEIGILKNDMVEFLKNKPDFKVSDVGKFVRELYPTANIKRYKIGELYNYLNEVRAGSVNTYSYYKIYSLIGRLGIHAEIDNNTETQEIVDTRSRGPLLIDRVTPYKWYKIPWGHKKKKHRFGQPVITQEELTKINA